jgi:hypothetical protein
MTMPRPSRSLRRDLSRRHRRVMTCLAALLFLAAAHRPAAAALHPHERDGWMVGLGFGGGSAAITSGGVTSDREGGTSAHLRAGYVLTPRVSIGVEGNSWFKTIEGVDWMFDTFTAEATVYPGSGFTLRAGIGGGTAEAAVSSGNVTTTATESGLGMSTGVGYEIRVARKWAIVPQFDVSFVNLDSFKANYATISVAAHWYLLPKK